MLSYSCKIVPGVCNFLNFRITRLLNEFFKKIIVCTYSRGIWYSMKHNGKDFEKYNKSNLRVDKCFCLPLLNACII